MSTRQRAYVLLLVLSLLGAAIYLNSRFQWIGGTAAAKTNDAKKKDDAKKASKEAVAIEVTPAVRGSISSHIQSSGNIRALRDVEVAAQAEGIVAKVLAEEGDHVKAGQVLCLLDDEQSKIRVDLAQAKLAQARLQLEKARIRVEKNTVQAENRRIEYERYKTAFDQGLVSETEVSQRRYQYDELVQDGRVADSETREFKHRVEELEAEIAQAQLDLSRTHITAPFDGLVTRRLVDLGQRVRNLDPMFSLGAFTPLFVDIYVPEREAAAVKPGQLAIVRLGAEGDIERRGQVERTSPIVDQSTGTVKVTVRLDAPGTEFRPGAFARVAIETDTRTNVVLIPKRAIIEEDGSNYVYIAKGDGAGRSKIEIGYENDTQVEVKSGIQPGDRVVVAGQGGLKQSSKVKVIGG